MFTLLGVYMIMWALTFALTYWSAKTGDTGIWEEDGTLLLTWKCFVTGMVWPIIWLLTIVIMFAAIHIAKKEKK